MLRQLLWKSFSIWQRKQEKQLETALLFLNARNSGSCSVTVEDEVLAPFLPGSLEIALVTNTVKTRVLTSEMFSVVVTVSSNLDPNFFWDYRAMPWFLVWGGAPAHISMLQSHRSCFHKQKWGELSQFLEHPFLQVQLEARDTLRHEVCVKILLLDFFIWATKMFLCCQMLCFVVALCHFSLSVADMSWVSTALLI